DPLPDPEQAVLLKALSKQPADRYATCREFIQALEHALAPVLGLNDQSFMRLTVQAPRSARTVEVPGRDTENQLGGVTAVDPFASVAGGIAKPGPSRQRPATTWDEDKKLAHTEIPIRPEPKSRRVAVLAIALAACGLATVVGAWKVFSGSSLR